MDQGKSVIEPSLTDTLFVLKQDIFATLNCVKIGEIQSFDTAKKTAQIKLLFKRVLPDGTTTSCKPLVDCPVFTLQGGGGFIQFPIAAGDQCIVLFSDRNIDAWFETAAEGAPYDGRLHDMSDGIALVGLNALPSSMPAYPTNQVSLSYGGTLMSLKSDQAIISHGGGQLIVKDGSLKFADTGGAEVDFTAGLISIKNATTSLLTLLNGLVDVLTATLVQGPSTTYPLTAATIAALNAYKTQFAVLLQ